MCQFAFVFCLVGCANAIIEEEENKWENFSSVAWTVKREEKTFMVKDSKIDERPLVFIPKFKYY